LKKPTSNRLLLGLLLTLTCALTAAAVKAQQSVANPSPTPAATSQAASQSSSSSATTAPQPQAGPVPSPTPLPPKVTSIVEGHLELDDTISVQVDHLTEWAANNDPAKLVPYLNGRALRGNYPEEIHASRNHLLFHLEITPENKEVWTDLLGAPTALRHPVAFTVGLENQTPFDSVFDQTNRIPLTVISPWYGVVSLLVVLFTLVLFLWLAATTNLIREPGAPPAPGKHRPYNLGRAQMAFWFFLIYVSYIVIWLITDAIGTITPSLLGLMGISAGTALSEALIDSGKATAAAGQRQDLTAEKQALELGIPELQAQVDALNARTTLLPEEMANRDSLNKQLQDSRTRLAQISQQIASLTPTQAANVSKGFIRDALSDSSGYSFHRFQIFAWTIALGIIFVSSVYNNLTMPEFSTTMLGLMGISSGTYIGFKFPEQK
jgi:hypothetical protein